MGAVSGRLGTVDQCELLDQIPSLVAHFDKALQLQYANKSFMRSLGIIDSAALGKRVEEVLGAEMFTTIQQHIPQVFSGTVARFDIEGRFNGQFSCYTVELSPVPKDDGGFIFHATDITSKATTERELRDYVDNAAIGLHWVNAEGIITWANAAELKMLGYQAEEYIGHHIREFHADNSVITDILCRLENKETLLNYEAKLKCKDGSIRYVSLSSNVLWANDKFVRTRCFSVDVTAQKQLSSRLHYEEKRYHTLLNILPVAIYTCDKEGKITYFNDVAKKLWGYTPDINSEALRFCACYKVHLDDGTFIPPDQTPMAIAVKTGQSFRDVEAIVTRPDGTQFNASVSIEPLLDDQNNVCGAINAFQDITRLKQIEQALRESDMLHKQVLELLPAAVYTCDNQGKIKLFNKAASTLWGREPEIGKDMWCGSWKIFNPVDESPVELDTCPMAISLKEGRAVYNEEILVERPDGLRRNVAPHPRPIFNSGGEIVGAVNMLLDITEQKNSARAIKESEARFRMMADLVPIVIWLTDEWGKCTYINPQWTELSGAPANAGLGEGWFNYVHGDDKDFVTLHLRQSILKKTTFDVKFRYLNSILGYRIHRAFGNPRYDDDGKFIGHIGIMQDVSKEEERKESLEKEVIARTEELHLKNVTLEKVNQDLASFAYVSSHDLQEPLRKIQAFSTRIRELDANSFSPKSLDYFERISTASKRMRALIEDLLAYSRANTSERKFEFLDLNDLLSDVLMELEDSIQETGAIVLIGAMPKARVIQFQFQQLAINILSNAFKFSKPGVPPIVEITADVVDARDIQHDDVNPAQQYHHISFTDNGIGFESEYNEKIFEVFQRLHTRSAYTGTGVGLAICKKITENHDGLIVAEGKLGIGSTFHIYLPVTYQAS
jgi:PAS domain S-box-containing protein